MPKLRLKDEKLRRLAQLRFHRRTFQECALEMGVGERTLRRWAKGADYLRIAEDQIQEWRLQGRGRVAELADEVIGELRQLMTTARSEFVRFQAAAKLGDWFGLGEPPEKEEVQDDRDALKEVLLKLAERQNPRSIAPVLPGGLLPSVIEGEIVRESS